MPSTTSPRPSWIRLLPALALAALLPACHKTPPPPPAPVATAAPGSSAVRINTLNAALQLSDEQREFLVALQPVILRENMNIAARRKHLQEVADRYLRKTSIDEEDFVWVKALAEDYQLEPESRSDHHFFDSLLARVDEVPPSLVLAHVALASGWPGTPDSVDTLSFHLHICHRQYCVRRGQLAGDSSDPQTVANQRAIGSYMNLLNSDPAYAEFRELRAGMRAYGAQVDGLMLAPSLKGLSLVGDMHVEDIELMISANHLQDMD
jgi:Bax protein